MRKCIAQHLDEFKKALTEKVATVWYENEKNELVITKVTTQKGNTGILNLDEFMFNLPRKYKGKKNLIWCYSPDEHQWHHFTPSQIDAFSF